MIGTDTLSLDSWDRTAALVAHLWEEGMSFGMTSVQSGSHLMYRGTFSSPSCVDKCDIIRAVPLPDVEWRGLGPGLQTVWRSTPLPSVWLDL